MGSAWDSSDDLSWIHSKARPPLIHSLGRQHHCGGAPGRTGRPFAPDVVVVCVDGPGGWSAGSANASVHEGECERTQAEALTRLFLHRDWQTAALISRRGCIGSRYLVAVGYPYE